MADLMINQKFSYSSLTQ